jgi:selenoprotein W-related protein
MKPRVEIEFCTACRFTLRAGWLAQELLFTFGEDLGEVALVPATGGVFEVRCGDAILWSRKREGRFPDAKELKQRLRDRIDPGRSLGHSDV